MNCLEAQRLIRSFLEDELPDQTTRQFLDHVEHCPSCMEELEINLIIQKMLDPSVDEGNLSFNVKELTGERIHTARRRMLRERLKRFFKVFCLALSGVILTVMLVMGIITLTTGGSLREVFSVEHVKKRIQKKPEALTENLTGQDTEMAEESATEDVSEDISENMSEKPAETDPAGRGKS